MLDPIRLPPAAADAILGWYDRLGRRLPFRGTTDPYAILVSEAMAQQTQAARAGDAWIRFMARFPTVAALSAATPAEVVREWQGLGYNRRALNLWRAARQIVEQHGGHVPVGLTSLESLPGVGRYTARAVAAIAFGRPVGAVDTNVRRVLGRIVAGEAGIPRSSDMQTVADEAVPRERPADWTHALMDVGAIVCRPRRPACDQCPARQWCEFAAAREARGPDPAKSTSTSRLRHDVATKRPPPFAASSRWLRGRIVDRLRATDDGGWAIVAGPIGQHGAAAVATALAALARDGLIELDEADPCAEARRARLTIA